MVSQRCKLSQRLPRVNVDDAITRAHDETLFVGSDLDVGDSRQLLAVVGNVLDVLRVLSVQFERHFVDAENANCDVPWATQQASVR